MGKQNVTYLIGAGASFYSIPVVNGLKERLKDYAVYVMRLNETRQITSNGALVYVKYINDLADSLTEQLSIDSYAKVLYDRREYSELNKLKRILSDYLVFEQTVKTESAMNQQYSKMPSIKHTASINKLIDDRYITFFNKLFDANRHALKDNVRILSWNYDSQFELAIVNKFGVSINYASEKLKVIPNHYNRSIQEPPSLIKLNGIAGYIVDDSYIERDSYWIDINSSDLNRIDMQIQHFLSNSNPSMFKPSLRFAFEIDSKDGNELEDRVMDVSKNTDVLVVIGYSFPDYNRVVDSMILNNMSNLKNVYFQVSKNDYRNIIDNKVADIDEHIHAKCQLINDLNEFFIPPLCGLLG